MNNIENIQNNLSNVVYLYENFRFDNALDSLTFEYEKKIPAKELKQVLNSYFVDRPIDSIDVGPLQHLDLDEDVALYSSYSAFRRISGVVVDGKKKLISFKYSFLTSVERAENGLNLLERDNIEEFKKEYPELTELSLFDETDHIMILTQHLESLVTLKEEEE
jgi:hypothetical protein